MEIKISISSNGELLMRLIGEFDALGVVEIRPELEQVAESSDPQHIVLDLEEVEFIDSSGVGAMVFLFKRLRAKERSLEIIGVHGQPRELLELLRVHEAIPVCWASGVGSPSGDESCAA